MIDDVLIKDVMKRDIYTIDENETLSKCVGALKERKFLIVLSQGKFKGIVNESLAYRTGVDLKASKVKSVEKNVPKLSPDEPLVEVARLMVENDARYLPVLENEKLIGAISSEDILASFKGEKEASNLVSSIMIRDPLVISMDSTLAQSLTLMRENGISRLLIIDGSKLVGVITMHDIIQKAIIPKYREGRDSQMYYGKRVLDSKNKSIMVDQVITIKAGDTISYAINTMIKHNISSLPVLKEDKVVGLVTKNDILKYIANLSNKTPSILVQFASKDEIGEELDMKKVNSILENLFRKYSKYMGNASITVYIKRHKERKRGYILTHVRLQVLASNYNAMTVGEGWGIYQALRIAMKNMERNIQRKKEKIAEYGEELLYDTVRFLT